MMILLRGDDFQLDSTRLDNFGFHLLYVLVDVGGVGKAALKMMIICENLGAEVDGVMPPR